MDKPPDTVTPGSRGKVFLSGASSAIARLRQVLVAEGFLAASAQRAGVAELWSTGLRRELETSDVLIALLDPPKDAPQTFYEVGLAEGMGKPILLVVSPETRLPVDLTGHVVVRPGDDLPGAVTYALRQWSHAGKWPKKQRTPERPGSPSDRAIGQLADELLARLARVESDPQAGLLLEHLIRDALAASAEIVVEAPDPDGGVDIGVWSDALTRSVGNPLLVEVRFRLPSQGAVHQLADQLSSHLRDSTARAVLLVYGGSPSEGAISALQALPPTILPIAADALLDRLRAQPLSDLIEELHGEHSAPGS